MKPYEYINNPVSASLCEWVNDVRDGLSVAAFGVTENARYYLASLFERKTLYVCSSAVRAKDAAREIECLTGRKTVFLPAKDDVLLYKKFFNRENVFKRIKGLYEARDAAVVTTTPEALCQLFPDKIDCLRLSVAREYRLDSLAEKLVAMGYVREEFAETAGSFALRGDILEIYPAGADTAYRFDFFGDSLEQIREIDENRSTVGEERSVDVLPCVDFSIRSDELAYIKKRLSEGLKKQKTLKSSVKGKQIVSEITERLESGDLSSPSLAFLFPLLNCSRKGIAAHFSPEVVFFDEPKLVKDVADGLKKEHAGRFASLSEGGEAFDFSFENYVDFDEVIKTFVGATFCSAQNVNSRTEFFSPLKTVRFSSIPTPNYRNNPKELARDILTWKRTGYTVIALCGDSDRARKLADNIAGEGVLITESDSPVLGGAFATSFYLSRGFVFHEEKLVLIGACDLFVSPQKKGKIRKKRDDAFEAPDVGDYAVHETHGIGIVRGMKRISTTEGCKDYLALEYAGGDVLYLPTEQLDRLTKYLGGDEHPRLNKIGGAEFDKVKQRVRESISQMTIDLKKLYRDRAAAKGFRFSPDDELTKEFDEAFPYELTEDQAQSVAEIKKDMESGKVMDRLLLGDVGFGKTEVALRAAFKAVNDGKQVAIVAPTTILTQQHYDTVCERFKGFGIRAVLLNRFRSREYIKDAVKKIAEGEADIIVGTHRIFGKDVTFKDLGLLILDEEQCFGVEHKEKLRTLKNNVDTLTMSATPIPRTLHMSLSGIRDISLILTPPKKRIPVQSYVLEESETLIRDALLKEMGRGGQTFILYNQVETIYKFAEKLQELVPEAKIIVGHGQMEKSKLEKRVEDFFKGEYDALVATTIIENGIDVPNANTLIVIDADKLGLFTLYQLKGRVGRSDRVARAYFTYKPEKVLSENSYKRLSALMEYTELGSGYKIAMKDLEIRGAGNVLGKEQHGHMDKIGYELYSKLLKEQLGEISGEIEVEADIRLDAYIPNGYISVSASRLDCYKAIAEIRSDEDEERVIKSITEKYGRIPREVENLILSSEIRNKARAAGAESVLASKDKSVVVLRDINVLRNGGVNAALTKFEKTATLAFSPKPTITIRGGACAEDNAKALLEFLKACEKGNENP